MVLACFLGYVDFMVVVIVFTLLVCCCWSFSMSLLPAGNCILHGSQPALSVAVFAVLSFLFRKTEVHSISFLRFAAQIAIIPICILQHSHLNIPFASFFVLAFRGRQGCNPPWRLPTGMFQALSSNPELSSLQGGIVG